jgi:D-beta-D-heptose 7-phosphate kinase / D-beta-D-heptose 1-phosphate adenosyltransferase
MIDLSQNSPKILVVGDLIIDQYLWGDTDNISPEAPVPIVKVNKANIVLGGAGNVIHNLIALGADADLISVMGDCETSSEAISLLKDINVETDYIVLEKNRITSKKTRIISSQQQVLRFDRECTKTIDKSSQNFILKYFDNIIHNYDCVLFSDYGKGLFSNKLTQSLIQIANSQNIKVLIDPKGSNYKKYSGAYLLTPNKKEAIDATGINIKDKNSLNDAIIYLKNNFKLSISLITLSNEGIAAFDGEFRLYPTDAREVFDVTGAGDTVLASLGFAIASKLTLDDAVKFSNLAAGVVVGKIGSATASLNEIIEYESSLHKSTSDKHIKTLKEIQSLCLEFKRKAKKIVFTNGCFDILHAGHVHYLEASKNLGDILIVGLNSDQSVKHLKGDNRPINAEHDRAYLLAALESVDYVVIFDEETPINLITAIMPDTLVKGSDYEGKNVVGQDIVEELKLINFIDGLSTSKIINKIKRNN